MANNRMVANIQDAGLVLEPVIARKVDDQNARGIDCRVGDHDPRVNVGHALELKYVPGLHWRSRLASASSKAFAACSSAAIRSRYAPSPRAFRMSLSGM